MNRPRMFGTNWKMNKTAHEAAEYADTLRELLLRMKADDSVQVFVLPPYTSISAARQMSGGKFWVGAQNMHCDEQGPYTGEISTKMLAELSVDLVQLGHAERREMCHENNEIVNLKVHAALRAGFRPLVCIGETALDREFHVERETCARQLRMVLKNVPSDAAHRIIIGYEPAWAIGENGTAADAHYVRIMNNLFRSILVDMFGSTPAECVPILYGGSVSIEDAAELLRESQVDGLFVGRAALDPTAFAALIHSCL